MFLYTRVLFVRICQGDPIEINRTWTGRVSGEASDITGDLAWAPRSLNLSVGDFFLWDNLKENVLRNQT